MPKLKFSTFNDFSLKGITSFWVELIGNPSQFSLERSIFHGISVGLIFLTLLYIPYNLYAGLYVGSFSAFLICLFFCHQYYYSRFYGRPHSNTLFGLIGIVIFGVNYFFNSGINGSTDLIWPAYLLLVFTISPYRQHLTWLLIYLVCFFILHTVEYYYPHLVQHPFSAGRGQFIDRITVFPMPAIAIYIIIKYIRRSYDRERKTTAEKTLAVELSKAQISTQKDELEQRNMEKNKLMSIITHDLRTPLLNIQNYLALLTEHGMDIEERSQLEKALLHATDNAVDMLSNLLRWSKSQMEGPSVKLVSVNLFEALSSTLTMEQNNALKKGISFSYAIAPDLKVMADVDMLQLVIRNLISNAIKFTAMGGQIHIDAQLLADECKITVSDNGKGIEEAKQDRIFSIKSEPAFGTNNERGVGLGLVLCKEYTALQGGRIEFKSSLGKGSDFFIYLPLK